MSNKIISFIIPSRNNLKYLKWCYTGIRKHLGYEHEICWADDFSNDGTWEWMQKTAKNDGNIKIHRNNGPKRLGHTILYDTLINEYATNDIVMIFHADMLPCPNMDVEVLKHLKPGTVVSATRIEPPLHPDGPEKILADYGIEPEEFQEERFLREYMLLSPNKETTEGIFAPWAIMKEDFQSIGGHDPLFAPQSKEDSDAFNRMQLNGYKFIQTWEGYVYHMTCRGSRFKDGAKRNLDGQVFMKNRESNEWLRQNAISTRNFIRKWGSVVKHDKYLKPIISPKYDIGFKAHNCNIHALRELEPWCSTIYAVGERRGYVESEQKDTLFNLCKRVIPLQIKPKNDIIVEFDCELLTSQNFQILVNLSEILQESGEIGEMVCDIFKITINSLKTYEHNLIIADKSGDLR